MGDDPTRLAIAALSPEERRILAALAVVGRATLSTEELAGVAEVADATPIVDDLRRRGLVVTDEEERHSILRTVAADIRKTDEAASTAEHLRANFETLARGGKLTPARLMEDAEAILGLSDWLAEHGEWEQTLELVQTVEASFSLAETATALIALLRHGAEAARMLGNSGAEFAMLQRLATASSRSGDDAAAQRYALQAEMLRAPPPPPPPPPSGLGTWRIVAIVVGVLAAAGIGLGVGLAVAGDDSSGSTPTVLPVTLTLPGETSVTVETATLPAETLLETVTEVVTETETLATTETAVTTVFTVPTIG